MTFEFECKRCGTRWTNDNFICSTMNICSSCDTNVQPYLSNPKNRESVIKYIDKKYWKYIFEDM